VLLLQANDLDGAKKVIDISGDGPNNWSRDVNLARDEAVAQNITINGLPILGDGSYPGLDRYFTDCVIGGRGAFIVTARGFQDFARAIRNKLVLEISEATPQARLIRAAATAPSRPLPAPRPVPSARGGYAPQPNEKGCENRYGFGNFGGFDFPPRR
jgi:hypothetical protein